MPMAPMEWEKPLSSGSSFLITSFMYKIHFVYSSNQSLYDYGMQIYSDVCTRMTLPLLLATRLIPIWLTISISHCIMISPSEYRFWAIAVPIHAAFHCSPPASWMAQCRIGLTCVQICWICVDRDVSLSDWKREEIFLLLYILENGGFSLGEIQNNFISSFGEFSFGLSSRMYCTLILSALYLSLVMDRYIRKNLSYYLLWCERILIVLSVFLLAVVVIHFTLIIPR